MRGQPQAATLQYTEDIPGIIGPLEDLARIIEAEENQETERFTEPRQLVAEPRRTTEEVEETRV